jgi:hypothetical protein
MVPLCLATALCLSGVCSDSFVLSSFLTGGLMEGNDSAFHLPSGKKPRALVENTGEPATAFWKFPVASKFHTRQIPNLGMQ